MRERERRDGGREGRRREGREGGMEMEAERKEASKKEQLMEKRKTGGRVGTYHIP